MRQAGEVAVAIHARRALLENGWARDVRVEVTGGAIARILPGVARRTGDTGVDTLLPAPGNLHSHSFQRAMAGMTEVRRQGRDNFWSWRALMYRFVPRLTPDHVEAIAGYITGKRVLVSLTLGGREHMFGEGAIHGPLEDMLRPLLRGTLAYVGMDVLPPFVAWHVPYISHAAREEFLVAYQQRLSGLERDQPLAFPRLQQFDERLYPLPQA